MKPPLIGISVDNIDSDRYLSNIAYSEKIAEAGGVPLLLPQEVKLAARYVEICDGIVLTGGSDARLDGFGIAQHPLSQCIEPRRQEFEMALLDALAMNPTRPVLGICLGMQLMSLHAGGRMNQHLQDVLSADVEEHQHNHRHEIVVEASDSVLLRITGLPHAIGSLQAGDRSPDEEARRMSSPAQVDCGDRDHDLSRHTVVSSHHQSVEDAGRLRVVARSPAGVIETVDDSARFFFLGVQWHPERGVGLFNFDLLQRFVDICRR